MAGKDLEGVFRRCGRKPEHLARPHSRLRHFFYRLRTDRRACRSSLRGIGLLAQAEATVPSRCLGKPSLVTPCISLSLAVMTAVLAFNLRGDAWRDWLDPRNSFANGRARILEINFVQKTKLNLCRRERDVHSAADAQTFCGVAAVDSNLDKSIRADVGEGFAGSAFGEGVHQLGHGMSANSELHRS